MSEYDTANEHELCFQIGKLKRRIAELEKEVARLLTERDDVLMAEAHYIAKVELAKKDARIAELEAAQHWHVVDDGDLPIVGKSIMFYDSSSEEIYRGVYMASHHWRANCFSEKCETVTHWMPLPPNPEVQE